MTNTRKVFLIVIVLMAVAYIIFSLAELGNILAALRQSKPLYSGVAVLVEAVLLVNTAATFWALYRLVGLQETPRSIFVMVTAATFLNLVTPSSGMGGMAVFYDEARRHDLSTGRVTVVAVLYVLYEYVALFAALAVGFVKLVQLGKLNIGEVLAVGFLLVVGITIAAGLAVGYRSTIQLGKLLAWLAGVVNRMLRPFVHRDYLNISSAYNLSDEMVDGLSSLRSASPGRLLLPLVFTVINKLLLILILALSFAALGTPASAGTVVAGFSIGHLFVYASPTPSGLGFVDSILPLALNSLGVPFPRAVLVSLVYRAVTFWLPLVLGAVAFRYLQRSRMEQAGSR